MSSVGASRQPLTIKKLLVSAAVIAAGLVLAILVVTAKPKPQPSVPEAPLAPVVAVVAVTPKAMPLTVVTQGTVEPMRRINLSAQVSGKVLKVGKNFLEGAYFEQDELLVQLEQADYEFAIARAKAQVAAAEQRLAEERGRNLQAKREWRELGSKEANALFLRLPQLKSAEAALDAAKADLAAAELALERTTIRAPFAGRLERKQVDVGQFLGAGSSVATIHAADTFEVRLPLSDSQWSSLGLSVAGHDIPEHPVTLSAQFGTEQRHWQAVIRRFEAALDPQSRIVQAIAEVRLDNGDGTPQQSLTSGMFVQADIQTPPVPGLVQLPLSALRADDTVMVVDQASTLVRKPVIVRERHPDWVRVSGLLAGERVVSVQTPALLSGLEVTIASDAATTSSTTL